MNFLQENINQIMIKISEHLMISMLALFLGILLAIPLGLFVSKNKRMSKIVIAVSSVLQTIPSLALLAIMVPLFGVGKLPAVLALFIYSLLPILRNTVLGMDSVDENIIDAAMGMGMTDYQIIMEVQVPLSLEVIMSGVRLSAIYVLAWGSLASYIGAGGLGDLIFYGLNNFDLAMILAGTLPITVMALIMDAILGKIENVLVNKYGRKRKEEVLSS